MRSSKKKMTDKIHTEVGDVVDELAEAILEESEINHAPEAFERYAQQLRHKIYGNRETFREKLSKGYEIILNEIASRPPSH